MTDIARRSGDGLFFEGVLECRDLCYTSSNHQFHIRFGSRHEEVIGCALAVFY